MHFVLKIEETLSDLEYNVCRRSRSDFKSDVSFYRHLISKRTSLFLDVFDLKSDLCLKCLFFLEVRSQIGSLFEASDPRSDISEVRFQK